MKRVLVVAGALLLSIGAVMAQQDVVKQTQTDDEGEPARAIGGVLGPMVKGEKPYDQATVDAALTQFDRYRQEAADACFRKASRA